VTHPKKTACWTVRDESFHVIQSYSALVAHESQIRAEPTNSGSAPWPAAIQIRDHGCRDRRWCR